VKANFKIDMYGNLLIERKGKLKKQFCPKTLLTTSDEYADEYAEAEKRPCGDWCPLFGEPIQHNSQNVGHSPPPEKTWLTVCTAGIRLEGECKDERS